MGTESVTINDGEISETIVLSQEWTEFVAFSSTITIDFTNDDGTDRDIDFESNFETNIIAEQRWSNWDCDSDNENWRCQTVRNGRFAWDATYLITFGEEITGKILERVRVFKLFELQDRFRPMISMNL